MSHEEKVCSSFICHLQCHARESRTTKVSYLAKNLIFIGIRRHNQAMQMSGNGLSLTLIHAHIQITKSSKWSDDWPAKLTAVSV